jgi:TolB-like protein/Flp pilus assembly protein TadD
LSLFNELKRRNVFRVGAAYVVSSWLLIQVAETIFPLFGFGDAPARLLVIVLAIGFIPALIFSWVFELTPDGLKKEDDIVRSQTITPATGKKLDRMITVVLVLALGYFAFDKFVLDPARDVQIAEIAAQAGVEQAQEEARLGMRSEKSIAVLPFINRSQQPEDESFTDGMHDEVLTRLAKIAMLKVVSRTSVMRYRDTDKSIPEIAEELSVASILEGGVQRVGNQVRINMQLINAYTDKHLWAEIYDRELTARNLFVIQSDISKAIAQALRATLTSDEEQMLDEVPTENLAAYDAYVSARVKLDSAANEDLSQAVANFTLATQLDPDFASAWAGLCEANLGLYTQSSDKQYFEAAEAACNQALVLDDSRVEVHIALGTLYRILGQYSRAEVSLQSANYARAEQALENALSIGGPTVDALVELGTLLAYQNRLAEAETELLSAAELEPDYWTAQTALFFFYYKFSSKTDHYELAARYAVRAASLRPDMAASWNNLGTANFMLARYDLAADAWQHSLSIEPTRTAYTNTGLALYNAGRFKAAAEMQLKAAKIAPNDHRAWGRLADAQRFVEGEGEHAAKNFARAASLARDLLEINNQDWRTLGMLSVYLARMNEGEEAMALARRAMQLSSRNPETLFYTALVHLSEGQTDACLTLLEEAVAKDEYYRYLIEIDPDLDQLSELMRFQAIIATP